MPQEENLAALSAWCPLDRLQLMKLAFFSAYVAAAVFGAFGSLLLQSKGFSQTLVGFTRAFSPVFKFLLLPPLSVFAETRNLQLPLLRIGLAFCTAELLVILLTSSITVAAVTTVLFNLSYMHIFPFLDEYGMTVLGPSRKDQWGEYRSFGAYGWAVSAVVTSIVFGYVGWIYVWFIWVAAVGTLVFTTIQAPVSKVAGNHGYVEVLRYVWQRPRIMNYFFGCACMGGGGAIISAFLFPFLKDEMAPSPVLYGLCLVFTVSVEIPLFRCSKWLHANFTDRQLLLTAMITWCVRVTGYTFLTNAWYVLLLEPLHGLTFGLTWLGGVHFFSSSFPSTQSNTAFGLLHASSGGIGPIIGNVIGGGLYDRIGPRDMFRLGAAVMLVAAMAFDWLEKRQDVIENASNLTATAGDDGEESPA